MSKRFDYTRHSQLLKPLFAIAAALRQGSLEPALIELVLLRVSQLNGCAFCIDMHTLDARAGGESEQRLYLLQAWREAASLYSERERAALAWAEAVTKLGEHGVADEIYEQALAAFGEAGLVELNMAVVMINAWNRFGVPFQAEPGHYRPAQAKPAA